MKSRCRQALAFSENRRSAAIFCFYLHRLCGAHEWRQQYALSGRHLFFCSDPAGHTNCVSVFDPNGWGVFCLYQAGELRSAERGRLPRPRLGQRGRDTCGFPSSLNSYLSLGDSTAKIGEAGPLRNRGTAVGLPLRVFLRLFAVHRQRTATQTVESTQARHDRAAQPFCTL